MAHRKRLSRLEYLWSTLSKLEEDAEAAAVDRSWTAVVNARTKAIQLRERIDELEQIAAARKGRKRNMTPAELYDELAADARALKVGAMASASHVAAAQALRLEQDLVAMRAQAASGAADAAREALPVEEIEAEIIRLRTARGA